MPVLSSLPVVLPASSIVFPTGTAEGQNLAIAATQGIRNTEAVGVLIDKIVVQTTGISTNVSAFPMINLRWRNYSITDSFIPVTAAAWPQNRLPESRSNYSIKLSKPIYLAPGEFIYVAARSDLFPTLLQAATVSVVGIGRQCAAPPATRWLPFLPDYLGPVYQSNTGNPIADQSTPADLGNPFDVPLVIERMIGRVLVSTDGIQFDDLTPRQVWNTFQVRISDHRDNFWVATPSPVPIVFSAVDCSWIMNHTLEPKGFLRVEFEGTANVSDAPVSAYARAVVGLVSYRRIA